MDFYYKYKNADRKLCSTFRHRGIVLNLYLVNGHMYVICKNRSIIYNTLNYSIANLRFLDSIFLESRSAELFND